MESEEDKPKTQKSDPQRWTPGSEKLLLAKHKEITESKRVPRNKWLKIAAEINQHNYNFSSEQCRLTIKTLKEKYDRIKKKNKTSGESPCTEDEDLEENFNTFPDMNPRGTFDSGSRSSEDSISCRKDTSLKEDDAKPSTLKGNPETVAKELPQLSSDEEESAESSGKKKERKRPKRSSDAIIKFLGEFIEKKEEASERRHQEKLKVVTSLIDVLKDSMKK